MLLAMEIIEGKKACTKCHLVKPVESFSKNSHNKNGLMSTCKSCNQAAWAKKPGRPHTPRKPYVTPTEKFCNGCKRTLPAGEFLTRTDRGIPSDGKTLVSRCQSCLSKAHKEWREKNEGASRLRNLKSKYGMSGEDYFRILESQEGGCGICGSPVSGWKTSPFLHVDHDHNDGLIRGLLCHPCNVAVGMIESNNIPMDKLDTWMSGGTAVSKHESKAEGWVGAVR